MLLQVILTMVADAFYSPCACPDDRFGLIVVNMGISTVDTQLVIQHCWYANVSVIYKINIWKDGSSLQTLNAGVSNRRLGGQIWSAEALGLSQHHHQLLLATKPWCYC